jgi:hypothetical protein
MSFREKSAWITLVTVLVCFGAYFGALAVGHVRGFHSLYLLLFCGIALAVLQIGLHVVAAATTPKDGRAPRDEREILIQWRSHTLGYYVLMGLVLALFVPVHFPHSAIDMANFALLGVVIASLVVAVAQIVMFRRGG